MKLTRKRIWIGALLLFVIAAAAFLLLFLNQKPEPVVSVFLTELHTVEDPVFIGKLYEERDQQLQRKMEQAGAQSVMTLEENEDPLYAHYSRQYASLCTKEGFENMISNQFFAAYGKAAMNQNWKLSARTPVLDQLTPNQYGYTIDVTVTNIATGEQKTVPQQGIILVKRTLLGYKIEAIQM